MRQKELIKLFIVFATFVLSLSACSTSDNSGNYENDSRYEIYRLALNDGYTGTYEEWLLSIKGKDGSDGHSPVIIIGENGNWFIDGVDTNVKAQGAQGPKGDQGEKGDTGAQGIQGPKGDKGDTGVTGKSAYQIALDNGFEGTEQEWLATFGQNGKSAYEIAVDSGFEGTEEQWLNSLKGDTGAQGEKGDIGSQGVKGDQGEKGDTGVSIVSIKKTSTNGLTDTYTITFSDNHISTFTVTNGAQGIQGVKGNDGHTPEITISDDGYWVIDGEKSSTLAQGIQGGIGDTGLSAYELYVKYHPDYEGTESDWIEDLVNGNLREKYTIRFNTNGGTSVESQKVSYGHLVTNPGIPERNGYIFDGWYYNGNPFPFNSFQVFDDITIYATWKSSSLIVSLDADGGIVEYNTKNVTYGIDYVLPTPTRDNYSFEGWYYDNDLCPLEGKWNFAKDNITLKARWSGTIATVSYAEDNNIEMEEKSTQIVYGQYFSLPVPTIVSGDPFIGWADSNDNLVTDYEGNSLKKSSFKSNVLLHAVYYVEIATVNEWLKLCSYDEGSKELNRTYVLTNDLDFTGLANGSVKSFNGTLNGNGHRIIGMSKPMFSSIKGTTSRPVEIYDLVFVNFSGSSVIENDYGDCILRGITIHSFVKDVNNYCEYYGLIKTVSGSWGNMNITIDKCFINDEFATVECGFIHYLKSFNNVVLKNSSVKSNTKKSAFIGYDIFSEEKFESISYEKDKQPYNTNVYISYCSNYGSSSSLAYLSAGSYGTYDSWLGSISPKYKSRMNCGTHNVFVDSVVNYGTISDSLFVNNYKLCYWYCDESDHDWGYDLTLQHLTHHYFLYRTLSDATFEIKRLLNFGDINKMVSCVSIEYPKWHESPWGEARPESFGKVTNTNDFLEDKIPYVPNKGISIFDVSYSLNAGLTHESSLEDSTNKDYVYYYLPISVISDDCLVINAKNQINDDFFINTIGLESNRWDLTYINIEDPYGLPQLLFD